jgi:hypothetical protein
MSDDAPSDETAPARAVGVKGARPAGPTDARHIARTVIVGIPVMVLAWLFLRWLHGALG